MTDFSDFDAVFGTSIFGKLARLTDFMKVVEEEIDRAMQEYPESAEIFWNMYGNLYPSFEFQEKTPELYQHHVRQILQRIGEKCSEKEFQLGTDAEILLTLSNCSLKAPMNNNGANAYFFMFKKIFPDHEANPDRIYEEWPGALEEEIFIPARRRIANSRKLKRPSEKELHEIRQRDVEHGNIPKWQEYCKNPSYIQLNMLSVGGK